MTRPVEYLDVNFGSEIIAPGKLWLTRFVLLAPMAIADRESHKAARRVVVDRRTAALRLDVPKIARYGSFVWAVLAGTTIGWEMALVELGVTGAYHFLKSRGR